MSENFWDNVRQNAYLKYLDKLNKNVVNNSSDNWDEAFREQSLHERIAEEAYLHYKSGSPYDEINWSDAEREIYQRLCFLAFYLHEANISRSAIDNWVTAQRIYLNNF